MGEFNGKISAEFSPPKTWVLNRELSFTTDQFSAADIEVLERVGANITKSGKFSCLIAPWDCARAAVIHDHLYAVLRKYYHSKEMHKPTWTRARALSDKVFLLGMKSAEPKISKFKMYSAYWSVRACGRWPASANPEES